MVFRVEVEFAGVAADGGGDGASDDGAGDFAVEIVKGSGKRSAPPRQGSGIHFMIRDPALARWAKFFASPPGFGLAERG